MDRRHRSSRSSVALGAAVALVLALGVALVAPWEHPRRVPDEPAPLVSPLAGSPRPTDAAELDHAPRAADAVEVDLPFGEDWPADPDAQPDDGRRVHGLILDPTGWAHLGARVELVVGGVPRAVATSDGNGHYELRWRFSANEGRAWIVATPAHGPSVAREVHLGGLQVRRDVFVAAGPIRASLRLSEPRWEGLPLELTIERWWDSAGQELGPGVVALLDRRFEWELGAGEFIALDGLAAGRGRLRVADQTGAHALVDVSPGEVEVPVELPLVGPLEVLVLGTHERPIEAALVLASDAPDPPDAPRAVVSLGPLIGQDSVRAARTDGLGRVVIDGLRRGQRLRVEVAATGSEGFRGVVDPKVRTLVVRLDDGLWPPLEVSRRVDPQTVERVEAVVEFALRPDRPAAAGLLALPPSSLGLAVPVPLDVREWLELRVSAPGCWPRSVLGDELSYDRHRQLFRLELSSTVAELAVRVSDDRGRPISGGDLEVEVRGELLQPLLNRGLARVGPLPAGPVVVGFSKEGYVPQTGGAVVEAGAAAVVTLVAPRLGRLRVLGERLEGVILEPAFDVEAPLVAPAVGSRSMGPRFIAESNALFSEVSPGSWRLIAGCEPVDVVVQPGQEARLDLVCETRGPWWGHVLLDETCGPGARRVRAEDALGRAEVVVADGVGRFDFDNAARRLVRMRAETPLGAAGPWLELAGLESPLSLPLSEACLNVRLAAGSIFPEGARLAVVTSSTRHPIDPRDAGAVLSGLVPGPVELWFDHAGRARVLERSELQPGVNVLEVWIPRARVVALVAGGQESLPDGTEIVLRSEDHELAVAELREQRVEFPGVPPGTWALSVRNKRWAAKYFGPYQDWGSATVGEADEQIVVELSKPARHSLRRRLRPGR